MNDATLNAFRDIADTLIGHTIIDDAEASYGRLALVGLQFDRYVAPGLTKTSE